MKINNKQSGNVLFLILIAVALFAALSYAVTQSTRGGGNANDESSLINSAEIIQYAGLLKATVTRLRITNSCQDTEFNFENNVTAVTYSNPNAPINNGCDVFHADGGDISISEPPLHGGSSWFFSRFLVVNGIEGNGTNGVELSALLRDLDEDTCLSINKQLQGWDEIPNSIHTAGFIYRSIDGTFPPGDQNGLSATFPSNGNNANIGIESFCFNNVNANGGAGEYNFIQVLFAR
jgi:hypothetical protein